jgi:hypothetical protein
MILALIAVSHPEFAGKLYDQKLLLEDLLMAEKENSDVIVAKKKQALAFWSSVSLDHRVREKFQKDGVAF